MNRRPKTNFTLDIDFGTNNIGKPLYNGHAKPGPLDFGDRGAADPFEGVKDPPEEVLAHADAVVRAPEDQGPSSGYRRGACLVRNGAEDPPSIRRVFGGVGDDVHENLAQSQGVPTVFISIFLFGLLFVL